MRLLRACVIGGLLAALSLWLLAAPQFPALSGRVVDAAQLLTPNTRAALESRLAQHEAEDGNQLVVVTLEELGGYSIEDYGYQLGRHWGIGQADNDNGVLLIVAETERKVRIEVGYGLEGVLTDALSANIIGTQILPAFRVGDFESGIVAGADAIIQTIRGEYTAPPDDTETGPSGWGWLIIIVMLMFWLGGGGSGRGRMSDLAVLGGMILGGGRGGGFGGGGGGFGGGGASGGW